MGDIHRLAEELSEEALETARKAAQGTGPLSVDCPYCGELAGWPCRKRYGAWPSWTKPHKARRKAAVTRAEGGSDAP